MIEKYSLALICFLGITLSQIILSTMDDCTCRQITNENDCQYLSPYCYWNGQSCSTPSCYGLPQADCAQLDQCYFNGVNCNQFYRNYTCGQLNSTANFTCQQYSKFCFESSSGQCTDEGYQLPANCNMYQNYTSCIQSQQGLCSWFNGNCSYYSSCNSVPLQICQSYQPYQTKHPLGQYCVINNNQCVQAACNLIYNQTQCTYVQTFFNQDQFMLCEWNSINKTCQVATQTSFLTNSTCLSHTMGNYHWVTKNNYTTEGYCFKCQARPIQSQSSCKCEQLISQYDCNQNVLCEWQSSCISKTCNGLNNSQEYCIQNPGCAWIKGKGCTSFNKCQNLNGTNQYECLLQSLQCASSNGYQCLPLSEVNQYGCTSNTYGQCDRLITNKGFCMSSTNNTYPNNTYPNQTYPNNTQNSGCILQNNVNCYKIIDSQECQKFIHICYWNSYYNNQQYYCQQCIYNSYYCQFCGGSCQYASCGNYNNEQDCSYVYQNGQIIMCQWYPQNHYCSNQNNNYYYYDYYNIIPLNQNQCYSQSRGEYHWSSNNNKVGECLKCSLDYPQRKKNQCTCEELIYQGDCALAGESCLWNSQLAQCVQIDCHMLKTRSSCISNYNCHWIQVDDVMQCLPMTKCSNLPGSNSYQCLAYSYRCTQSDGQFCQELSRLDQSNKCSSIQNYTSCYLTIGSDGICAWNGQNCYALSECSQITFSNLCGINNYACQWNSETNKCISLNCENILTESECTYVDTTIDRHPSIQMCYWNNSRCANVTSISDTLTSSNCYINSGRTYSWSDNNSTKGHCESCSNDYLMRATTFIVLLLINY